MTTIEEIAPRVRSVVGRIVVRSDIRDDVIQEALIEVWRIIEARPGEDVQGLAMKKAREVARRVSMRASSPTRLPWTGSPSQEGKTRGYVAVFHGDAAITETLTVWDVLGDDVAELEADTDIRLTVDGVLTPEDSFLVYRRFWDGATFAEIGEELGISKDGAEKRWSKRIRPLLAEALR